MSDDLLDEALAALKAEEREPDEGEATLARLLASAGPEADAEARLDEAVAALRELDAPASASRTAATLARVQATLAPAPRRRWPVLQRALAVAAMLGVVFVAPSAWAFSRGVVARWMVAAGWVRPETTAPPASSPPSEPTSVERAPRVRDVPPSPPEAAPQTPPPSPRAPSPPEAAPQALPPSPPAPSTAPRRVPPQGSPGPRRTPPRAARRDPAPPSDPASAPAEAPPPDRETAAFREAHRLHFGGADPARSLTAWNAFLGAHPDGRYEPEARYNRATALVRLGRLEAARAALRPFARGAHGDYRREEASRLVDALTARIRDAGAP